MLFTSSDPGDLFSFVVNAACFGSWYEALTLFFPAGDLRNSPGSGITPVSTQPLRVSERAPLGVQAAVASLSDSPSRGKEWVTRPFCVRPSSCVTLGSACQRGKAGGLNRGARHPPAVLPPGCAFYFHLQKGEMLANFF